MVEGGVAGPPAYRRRSASPRSVSYSKSYAPASRTTTWPTELSSTSGPAAHSGGAFQFDARAGPADLPLSRIVVRHLPTLI
jgi:hypothetical protein